MPVVYGMTRSDGVGGQYGFRQAVYGYEEAMYNHRGRGFQGFRSVSSLSGPDSRLRTTTRFHQKFPLTGRIESVEVAYPESPNLPISVSEVTWRCERSDRNQPCPGDGSTYVAPVPGTIYAPFLDTQVDRTYDLPPPDASHGLVKTVTTSNALNATASAWDAYGNLLKQTVTTSDGGSGGTFVQSHVLTTESHYSVSTTPGNWWVDKLNWRTVDSSVSYHPINHALPGSASNPQRTRRIDYTWNSDRTPATQIVQSGIPGQESTISYAYPSPSYGLPSSVTTLAPGATPSTRTTSFTYTNNGTTQQADGYFVLQTTNPLLQTTTTETRPRDGQVSRTIAPNNLRTVTAYDVFGRPKQVNHRGWNGSIEVDIEPATYISLTDCDFAGGTGCDGGYGEGTGEEHAAYRQTTVKAGTPTQVTWFDNLGRVVKQSTRSFNNASFVQVLTEYSNIGKMSRQSTPHVSSPYWTTYDSYDRLDRLTAKTAPAAELDPLNGNRTTTYTYTGTRTDILVKGSNVTTTGGCPVNELCMEMSRFYDALGRLVKTLDANNQPTLFWYDAMGNPIAIKSPEGHLTLGSYDDLGRRTNRTDPDAGFASFTYDGFGQVLTATDARLVQTTMTYDALGRMVQRSSTNPAGAGLPAENVLDTWVYDPVGNPGALEYAKRQRGTAAPLPEVWRQTNTYFELDKRLETTAISMEGESDPLSAAYTYDGLGRPDTTTWHNGFAIQHGYNNNGYFNRLMNPSTGSIFWQAVNQDAWGNVTSESFGNGVSGSHQAYASSGQLAGKQWMTGAGGALDALDYDYDSFGNLKSQTRTIQGLDAGTETYEYDALQRLGHTALFGNVGESSPTTTYDYSPDGNIQYKSDANIDGTAANYYYGGQGCGPHAVTKVAYVSGSVGHYCDANGNDIGPNPFGSGDTAVYDFMNLPRRVTGGDFKYDANGNRYRGETVNGTTVYGPGGYERTTIGRTVTQRWELGPVVFTSMSGGAPQPTYVLRDRLGSTIALMADNRSASVLQTRSYDAFGRVRDGNFGRRSNADLGLEVTTLRGFTQHEHLNGGLIHMNGRMYDSLLGRFMSVDPIIQFPANSQSLNPYSYIMNNPLAGMDPSGYEAVVDDCTPATGSHICGASTKAGPSTVSGHEVNADGSTTKFRGTLSGNRLTSVQVTGKVGTNGAVAMSPQGAGEKLGKAAEAADQMGLVGNGNDGRVPPMVERACRGYSLPADCGGQSNDSAIGDAAKTHVAAGDNPIDPDWKNPAVSADSHTVAGMVATTLKYTGNVPDALVVSAANDWTGDGSYIQINPSRQDTAPLEIRYTDTATLAGYACMSSCAGAYRNGAGGITRGNTIYLDRYQPFETRRTALRHELGHYFFGPGHPKAPTDFLHGGVMEYGSFKVMPADREHFQRLYGTGGQV
jgi:RHS repeat-associated protein